MGGRLKLNKIAAASTPVTIWRLTTATESFSQPGRPNRGPGLHATRAPNRQRSESPSPGASTPPTNDQSQCEDTQHKQRCAQPAVKLGRLLLERVSWSKTP